ncbi:hypothetical protein Tco_1379287 [Tanacetum coccineum]
MASLEFCDKHNMVAYLEKSKGSEEFHQINVIFLPASHTRNVITECPTLYASPIEQFWQTAILSTNEDGVRGITATIDRKVKVFVSVASIRRYLKLEDSDSISSLPIAEIFEQLALMGPKKTAWEQLSSNIATAVICLATNHTFNFSNFIFEAMIKNLDSGGVKPERAEGRSPSWPRRRCEIEDISVRSDIPLFPTMLTTPESSPSRITSSPSFSPQTHPSISQPPSTPPSNQTTPITEEAAPMPHKLPLQSVHLLVRDEVSLSLNELTDLRTSLSKKIRWRRSRLVSSADVSTASELGSTTGVKAKDKGKAIMQESEPPKKIKRRVQVQISVDEELAKKVFMEEQAKFKAEHQQEKFDFETAIELQKSNEEIWILIFNKKFCFKKDEASVFVYKQPARGSRKKSLSRKRERETLSKESAKKQKLEDDTKKEELQVYLNIIPENTANVLELYRLVKERFQTASPKGYDLLLWGDLKTLIKPNEEDEIWRNQQYWNLINWKLHNFCEVHVLLMDTGFVIHMMAEKKYPLTQDTLSKMLSRRLEVDHQREIGYSSRRVFGSILSKLD